MIELLADATAPASWLGSALTIIAMIGAFLLAIIGGAVALVKFSLKLGEILTVAKSTNEKVEKLEEKHEKHSHLFTWLEARGFFSDDATAVVTEAPVRRSGTRSKTNPGETARHLAAVQSIHDDEGE